MRKVLSIVLALLMVSMMIPSMAFADGTLVTGAPTAALVATESFTLTATEAVTVKVNASVFDIGGEVDEATNIETKDFEAGEITITVEDAIPAEQFTSTIRVEAGEVKENIEITIKDRLIGDVDGSGAINATDSAEILVYLAELKEYQSPNFNLKVADVDKSGSVNATDSAEILIALAELPITLPGLVGFDTYIGDVEGIDETTIDISDPEYDATTPDVPVAEELAAVAAITAVVQEGTIYYDFTAVENASSYAITVNGVAATLADSTKTTGSFAATAEMAVKADGTDVISIVAVGDGTNYTDSQATETTISVATPSTALAEWLEANGLEDVVITVYEITAE